jgi:hypothetical protein
VPPDPIVSKAETDMVSCAFTNCVAQNSTIINVMFFIDFLFKHNKFN